MHTVHSFVAVLNILRKRHPSPWYYHEEPEADGHIFTDLRSVLEYLAQEGLIEKAPARDASSGIGARLTPRGLAVFDDVEAMDRLARGESPTPNALSDAVRRDFRRNITPWITYLLMALSIGVFALGLWQWYRLPSAPQDSGAVEGANLIDGKYFRLISSTFHHGGAFHLLMNMFALWSLGSFVERVYGRLRYLAIYLVAALGGTCLAMAFKPSPVLGASGAVCGILGAILVYMLTLARYLPRPEARSMWSNLIINIIIITVLSLLPGVSGLGHLGGGIAGALAAAVLVWQRVGGWTGAILGTLAVPLLAYGCFAFLQQVRTQGTDAWTKLETPYVERLGYNRTRNATNEASKVYAEVVEPLIEQRASRRDPARVSRAKELLQKEIDDLRDRQRELAALDCLTPPSRKRLAALQSELQARIDYYIETLRYLEVGDRWTREDEAAHGKMWDRVLEAIKEVRTAFQSEPRKPG
jgi:membrane associated rhomboid family serine protease